MAGRAGNKAWLRQQLQKALQWDADAAEAVVEAVAVAGSREEVEGLVEAYMGGNPTARQLVQQFCGPAGAQGAAASAAPAGMQVLQRDGAPPRQQQPQAGRGGGSGGGGGSRPASGGGGGRERAGGAPQTAELLPPADKPTPDLYMGPNVRTTVQPTRRKNRGGAGADASAGASAGVGAADGPKVLQKLVVNCLRCGKIFDCRTLGDEARRFLDSGGICSFCGSIVTLHYADGTTNAPPDATTDENPSVAASAGSAAAAAGPSSSSSSSRGHAADLAGFKPEAQQGSAADNVAYNDSAAAAVALKDRLVEYDRESAKRTTVYDDQSDFFEVDANAWLTDEERAVLKQREKDLAEAEEARRKKVMVSFDLLGRKVIVEEGTDGEAAGGPGDAAATEAKLEAACAVAATRAAAAATAAEAAQGGGAATATALAAMEEKLRDLRITVNPSMEARHFVFLPQQAQRQGQRQRQQQPAAAAAGRGEGAAPAEGGGGSGRGRKQQRKQGSGKGRSRLQHDDPFDWDPSASAVEVVARDEAGRRALEAAGASTAAGARA